MTKMMTKALSRFGRHAFVDRTVVLTIDPSRSLGTTNFFNHSIAIILSWFSNLASFSFFIFLSAALDPAEKTVDFSAPFFDTIICRFLYDKYFHIEEGFIRITMNFISFRNCCGHHIARGMDV